MYVFACVRESTDHSAASTRKHTDIDKRKNSTSSQNEKPAEEKNIYKKNHFNNFTFLWIDANKADIIPEKGEAEDRQLSG